MIIPGILEETFEQALERIRSVESVSPEIQIDIADGILVDGKTFFDIEKLNSVKLESDLSLHFMTNNPVTFLKRSHYLFPLFAKKIKVVSTVITQVIDYNQTEDFINLAKKLGYKVGLSLNYDQDIISLDPFLDKLDLVQFMSVIPGKQGNDFIPTVLEKIKHFKTSYPSIKTQIDGGINENNLLQVLATGVDNVIIGSAIFNSENPKTKYLEFSETAYGSTTNTN
jgi:ribulose-phosphate 3-epimerase